MRNWKPYIADVVRQMRDGWHYLGSRSFVLRHRIPAPAWDFIAAPRLPKPARIEMDFIDGWADHPLLAQAFAERLQPVWQSVSARIGRRRRCFLPRTACPAEPSKRSLRMPQGHPPPVQTLIPWKLSVPRRTWLHCSRRSASPPPTGFSPFRARACPAPAWIGPTVEDTLTALRQEGHSAVVIQPIGFLCDHVEILYDIDIGFRDFAAGIGLEVVRPPSLNDSPLLTAALEDLARQGFARLAAKASLRGSLRTCHDDCDRGWRHQRPGDGLSTGLRGRGVYPLRSFSAARRHRGDRSSPGFRHRVRPRFLGDRKALGPRTGSGARPRRPDHPLQRSMAAHLCAAGRSNAMPNWCPSPTACA